MTEKKAKVNLRLCQDAGGGGGGEGRRGGGG